MDAVAGFFSALPEEMRDPVLFAIPCFLLLLILEWTAARKLESIETAATGQPRPASGAYLTRDSVASISMGLVSIATTAGWKSLALLGYAAIYAYLAPWQLSAHRWYTWVIAIVGVDLLYYSYHRIAHRVRLIWATHQAHHSSEYFNFATALRQKWNNSGEILMWVPLPLMGLPPWMVFCTPSGSTVATHELIADYEAIVLADDVTASNILPSGRALESRPGVVLHPGQAVCHFGVSTGETCGTVESVNNGWFTMSHGVLSEKGDSGGPVYLAPDGGPAQIVGIFNSVWGGFPAAVSWRSTSEQVHADLGVTPLA